MGQRPNNAPSLSKAPQRSLSAVNTTMAPSPERREVDLAEAARAAAKERTFRQTWRREGFMTALMKMKTPL